MRYVLLALMLSYLLAFSMPAMAEEDRVEASATQGAAMSGVEAVPAGEDDAPTDDDTTQESAPVQETEGGVVLTLEKAPLPLTGVKIGIDPGHQRKGNSEKEAVAPGSKQKKPKVSSGTSGVATHIPEYVTVLDISLKLRDSLVEQGAEVYMTRETHDVNLSNQERAKMLSDAGVDLMLRIHCDGAKSRSKHGVALYCSKSNSIAAQSYRAAQAILPEVCAATGAKSNGIVSNDDYTGQNWATVPCIMVECGFMSNPDEDRLLNEEDYQWKIAKGLTNGIIAYIEERD